MATKDWDRANQENADSDETARWEERTKENAQAQTNEDKAETGRWEESKD